MWKSQCYKLVLLINKQFVHLQKLETYNIFDSDTLDKANQDLSNIMM